MDSLNHRRVAQNPDRFACWSLSIPNTRTTRRGLDSGTGKFEFRHYRAPRAWQ
ncbi:hypothetical protein T4B_6813 [Trichinella pseudospiralis]|uniref:Uncharacterized protein n=1 Tax=Trichinella pseudospiralis TaxID=6337 RepID=A0A0V1JTA0_TRIPS|nr:hypothetical protein T4E_9979 [Trichinella pseudospiralis]KRY76625.1 hypothetical protein T4A_11287 [Trichinella pseudospiralis]KRZ31617.1 hypothetical protein T4B_6813 [Trichinella pseudospiralis]KRZ38136.1 hypothetical protein T4C_1341 [Trichinella pseudospiralis]